MEKNSAQSRLEEIYIIIRMKRTCVGHSPQAIAPKTPHSCVKPLITAPRPYRLARAYDFGLFSMSSVRREKMN